MYPYHNKNYPPAKQSAKTLSAQESPREEAPDQKLLDLLDQAIQYSLSEATFLDAMMKIISNTEDRALIRDLYFDEKKHISMLMQIYQSLTGSAPATPEIPLIQVTSVAWQNFQSGLMNTMEYTTFLRQLYNSFLSQDVRDMLFEIIVDEQNHSIAMNYLFSKYYTDRQ